MASNNNETPKKKKIFKSPNAFSVLFIIIAAITALTWIIPSGSYNRDDDGKIVSGTYSQTEKRLEVVEKVEDSKTQITAEDAESKGYQITKVSKDESFVELKQGIWDVFLSPIKGMAERLDVIVFVLVLGGFLGVVMKTGALDAGIGNLLQKMNGKEIWLIPILMTLFAIGGTTYGMQEEAVAFYALVIPIMLAAGYNAMTAVMVIVLGAGTGVLASTVNPFSTGIAATNAEVQLGKILPFQGVVFAVSLIASICFTMYYAQKVKAGKFKSDTEKASKIKALDMSKIPEFTLERKFVLGVFATTFLVMVLSLIPWGDFKVELFDNIHKWMLELPVVGNVFGVQHNVALGNWYFNEISALFLISTVLVSIIYAEKFKEQDVSIIDTFLAGVGDLLSVALIIAVAAAIGVIMKAGGIQDTIVFWGESLLKNVQSGFVGVLAYLFYIPMSFIIPSSSGLATATMPIIAPVADLSGSSREVVVVAFATASGLLNMVAPTIASLMAGLSIAGVSYKTWVKRVAPIMAVFMIISLVVIFAMNSIM